MVRCNVVAIALLRVALLKYERVMGPVVKSWAKAKWGETQEAGQPLPRWLYYCRKAFGYSMKEHITADGHWDAFIIGTLIIDNLSDFLPSHLRGDDTASEAYRNHVHHVQYLRNSISHPPAPTAAEVRSSRSLALQHPLLATCRMLLFGSAWRDSVR